MALKSFSPQDIIYEKGSPVTEIALIIKGKVSMALDEGSIILGAGYALSLGEISSKSHICSYVCVDEVSIYTYPCDNLDEGFMHSNEKLAPTIAKNTIAHAVSLYEYAKKLHATAKAEYNAFKSNLAEYPALCASTGKKAEDFKHLETILNPSIPISVTNWKSEAMYSYNEYDHLLQSMYVKDTCAAVGFFMMACDLLTEIITDINAIDPLLKQFRKDTAYFSMLIKTLRTEASAISSGDATMDMPNTENMLSQILVYSKVEEPLLSQISQEFDEYCAINDRSQTDDNARRLRKSITEHFYIVYKSAFLKSINEDETPAIIKMFLYYGVMDERLVSDDDMKTIFGFLQAYIPDESTHIYTIYDWLKKIYWMEVEPSLNEFQLDFNAYLRELKQNGDITEAELSEKQNDPDFRLDYEIKNLFTMGNRMAYGRVSIYQPVFDSSTTMLPLNKSHLSISTITEEMDRIRNIDYQIFYRDKIWVHPQNESIQFRIHEEQTPFFILLPLAGTRALLWQSIEGRKRNTRARMVLPMFFQDNFTDSFTQLCGDFRWEICKIIQGVHWNDISDPSLTAEYNDYLQFYKSNKQLSPDMRQKVKELLKKYANNYKKLFVADYTTYIKYESAGNMRLMKYPRELLAKYCPFGSQVRDRLKSSPQYEILFERHYNKTEKKVHPFENTIIKITHNGDEAPEALVKEIEFLRG